MAQIKVKHPLGGLPRHSVATLRPEPCNPKPGTPEAKEKGCTCPIKDNPPFTWRRWNHWWVTGGCPVHAR